ncbi:MAG: cytochrome c peroxidase [Syntrophales bacterium]
MKKISWLFAILSLLVASAGYLMAAEGPSVELGKKLFNDRTLGGATGTVSCNTCHPGGKGLAKAGQNPDLAAKVNGCIAGALKGQKISPDSVEMKSLLLYIKTLDLR